MPEILICGAGKIGRGFMAHLAHRSGWQVSFSDASTEVIAALEKSGRYRVDIAGRPEASEYIPVRDACSLQQPERLALLVARCDLIACAVGASNLPTLARALAPALLARTTRTPLDWLILENADKPADTIRRTLLETVPELREWITSCLGLVETQVLRSGMPPDPAVAAQEPLAVRMHNWWTLPADADAFRSGIPDITGLEPRHHFEHELTRKIYTFNGLNGPISYLGWINGYRIMHEAALAGELQELLLQIHQESAHGLLGEFGFNVAEHTAFQAIAWHKYRDPALNDAIERNARDSARKLSARERLLGPAALCLKHGREPLAYACAISAAIHYTGSDDPGTASVAACLARAGIAGVLEQICGLAPSSRLSHLIIAAEQRRAYLLGRFAGGIAP